MVRLTRRQLIEQQKGQRPLPGVVEVRLRVDRLVCLVVVGCPLELAAALGFAFFFLEYLRARAGNAGGDEVGRVTVAERPTRVILLSASIHFSGVFLALSDVLPVAGPAVLLALTVLSIGQLGVTVRRQLLAVPLDAPGA